MQGSAYSELQTRGYFVTFWFALTALFSISSAFLPRRLHSPTHLFCLSLRGQRIQYVCQALSATCLLYCGLLSTVKEYSYLKPELAASAAIVFFLTVATAGSDDGDNNLLQVDEQTWSSAVRKQLPRRRLRQGRNVRRNKCHEKWHARTIAPFTVHNGKWLENASVSRRRRRGL